MSTNKRYSKDFKKTIVDLYNSGHSVKEISSQYANKCILLAIITT